MGWALLAVLLSLVGFVNSTYATLVYYDRIQPQKTIVPQMCPVASGACRAVFRTPEGKLFGLPTSLVGLAYYGIIFLACVMRLVTGTWPFQPLVIGIGTAGALYSVWLAFLLIFSMQTVCLVCFLAHGINVSLGAILVLSR